MAILKCKFCGGDISPFPGNDLGICSCCGATMTLPSSEDARRAAAHNAGNYFRRMGNFDKALSIYQQLLQQDPEDAEASWGSALCRFGIVYEEDPDIGGYTPVCRLPIPGSFLQDGDYLAALAHSDGSVRLQFEREATRIEALLTPPGEAAALQWTAPDEDTEPTQTEAAPEIAPVTPEADNSASQEGLPEPEDPSFLIKKAFRNLELGNWAEADAYCAQYIAIDSANPLAYLGRLLAQVKCRKPQELMECTTPFENLECYQKALLYAPPDLEDTLKKCSAQVNKRMQLNKIQEFYQNAAKEMERAVSEEDFKRAAAMFGRLAGFQDSADRRRECLILGENARKDSIYRSALAAAKAAKNQQQYRDVIDRFSSIPGWRDADTLIEACQKKIKTADAVQAVRANARRGVRIVAGLLGTALVLGIGIYLFITKYYIPQGKYDAAEEFLAVNEKQKAILAFQELGNYRDSLDRAAQIQANWYTEAEALLAASDSRRAAAAFGGLGDYSDARERSWQLWNDIADRTTLCAGGWYTAGLSADGMAFAAGDNRDNQCNVGSWLNIASISAGWSHTVGLRSDGTVVAAGYNGDGRSDVDSWRDIVAVSAGQWHTVGLKTDGRLIATGCSEDDRTNFESWRDMIGISAGRNHTLGLRADNTVAAAGLNGDGQCDVSEWRAIRAIAAGGAHSVGLKIDGTVVAAGCNDDGQCQVGDWENITQIAAGYYHTVGLKEDGTVVAVGLDWDMQCQVRDWTDIVAIAAGGWHTVGLKSDGTVVCVGRNENGQCETAEWSNMMLPE